MDPRSTDDREAKPGGKVRLLTLDDLDRRTRAAQRVHSTRAAIAADLGGEEHLSALERIAADNVAMLDAMTKDATARWLMGQDVDPSAIATLVNAFNRSGAVLGWQRRPRDVTPDLSRYMDAVASREAAE